MPQSDINNLAVIPSPLQGDTAGDRAALLRVRGAEGASGWQPTRWGGDPAGSAALGILSPSGEVAVRRPIRSRRRAVGAAARAWHTGSSGQRGARCADGSGCCAPAAGFHQPVLRQPPALPFPGAAEFWALLLAQSPGCVLLGMEEQ